MEELLLFHGIFIHFSTCEQNILNKSYGQFSKRSLGMALYAIKKRELYLGVFGLWLQIQKCLERTSLMGVTYCAWTTYRATDFQTVQQVRFPTPIVSWSVSWKNMEKSVAFHVSH